MQMIDAGVSGTTTSIQTVTHRAGFSRVCDRDAKDLALDDTIPPALRALLVADGCATLLLEAFFWEPIRVRVQEQTVTEAPESVLHRAVVFGGSNGRVYGCARSVVLLDRVESSVREGLLAGTAGMGSLLRAARIETCREVTSIVARRAGDDAAMLGVHPSALVVERTYRTRAEGRAIIETTEVFPVETFEGYRMHRTKA